MTPSSLLGRLLRLILGILMTVMVVLGVFSALTSFNEIQELADGRLAESARTLQVIAIQSQTPTFFNRRRDPTIIPSSELPSVRTYQAEVGFQIFDTSNHVLMSTQNLMGIPPPLPNDQGYSNVRSGRHHWRLFTQRDEANHFVIRTGERNDSRREILRALWIEHGLPLLIVLPLLAILMHWAIRRGLGPLRQLAVIDELAPVLAQSHVEMGVEFADDQIWLMGYEAALGML